MGRDTVQLETAVNTISHEYLLDLTSEYGIRETLHPALPRPEDRIVDFPEGKIGVYTRLIWCSIYNREVPLDFAHEAGASDQGTVVLEMPSSEDVPATAAPGAGQAEETATTDLPAAPESHKRGRDGTDVNASPKSLRRDHVDPRPSGSSHGGKSLAAIQMGLASTVVVPEDAPVGVSDPDPLFFVDAPSRHPADVAQSSPGIAVAGDPESENTSSSAEVASPGSYNVNLARQVAMGLQLRLQFDQEAKLLRKSVAQVARRDKRIQARELEIKNLEALLETEAGMKRAAEDKSARLTKELEDMCARFSDLQVSNEHLSQQVATLQEQVSGEEKLKAAFEEFKRWVIGHGLRLAVMKCGESLDMRQAFADVVFAGITKGMSEGLRHGVEYGQAQLNVESIEAYDPEAETKFVATLQALKDLKYPLLDRLEGLKDAPIDVIMASLYLESGTGEDTPQYIRDLRPSSSQLTIPVYPEVRDPRNPWAYKEEMKLMDAIAANISHAEKKKKCRIVCRTHGVGSAHHVRSDCVPMSVPMVVPQGLALLLSDATTQTEFDDT
uniref:Transposase (Putative), gypsy type n=1 Tax=Tanacetum cinerariifolium TaxID=118510 RepID=A0A6L2LYU6_TANCI|nr:hypothetical protein [Tanacetum cinerariifolium]